MLKRQSLLLTAGMYALWHHQLHLCSAAWIGMTTIDSAQAQGVEHLGFVQCAAYALHDCTHMQWRNVIWKEADFLEDVKHVGVP